MSCLQEKNKIIKKAADRVLNLFQVLTLWLKAMFFRDYFIKCIYHYHAFSLFTSDLWFLSGLQIQFQSILSALTKD